METYAPSCTALEWKEIMMMMTEIANKLPIYLNYQQLKNLGPRFVSNHTENNHRQVSSVGRAPVCSAGGRGFQPQTGPTLRVLK